MTADPLINFVSFGAEYQRDLEECWVKPAARAAGVQLVEHDLSFLGMRQPHLGAWGYHNLIALLAAGDLDWHILQVEDHCVYLPETLGYADIFAEFPLRIVNNLPAYLQHPRAIPAACGGYMVTWRADLLPGIEAPSWVDFFDRARVPGKRTLRDFPSGTIEIALVALGRDLVRDFYDPALPHHAIRRQVQDAFALIDTLGDDVVWWFQGYQSAQLLVTGEAVLGALWNRNLMKANTALGAPADDVERWIIKASPETSFIATDWFVIRKRAPHDSVANRLLETMFNDPAVLAGAAKYAAMQGNALPLADMPSAGSGFDHALRIGTWENAKACGFQDTHFWGRNWPWISELWKTWRIERHGAAPNSFYQSPPPPAMSESERRERVR